MASWSPSGPYAWASQPAAPSAAPSNWWNGVNDGLSRNSGLLLGLGSGLLSGNLSGIPQGVAQGAASDRSRNLQDAQLGLQAKQRNATAEWARKNGYGQYADEIESGAISGSDIFNLINKQTVVPFGSTVVNGNGETVAGGNSGQYGGTGLDAQNWNLVIAAQKDPSRWADPQTQAAWAQVTQPTVTYEQTPQGTVPVMRQPNIPQGWGPPSVGQQQPDAPMNPGVAPQAAPSGLAPGSGTSPASPGGPGISVGQALPGTKPAGTESTLRYKTITKILDAEVPNLQKNWKGLTDPMSQAAGMLPGDAGRVLQSPTYKRAFDSVTASIANILYALSGASSNPGEVVKQGQVLMPHFGDDPETQRASFDRLKTYIASVAAGTGDPDVIAKTEQTLGLLNFDTAGGGKTAPVTGKTSSGLSWSLN